MIMFMLRYDFVNADGVVVKGSGYRAVLHMLSCVLDLLHMSLLKAAKSRSSFRFSASEHINSLYLHCSALQVSGRPLDRALLCIYYLTGCRAIDWLVSTTDGSHTCSSSVQYWGNKLETDKNFYCGIPFKGYFPWSSIWNPSKPKHNRAVLCFNNVFLTVFS